MDEDIDPSQRPFCPPRRLVDARPGALIQAGDGIYRIHHMLDFTSLMATNVQTGRSSILRLLDLQPIDPASRVPDCDFAESADKEWEIAQERFAAIHPILWVLWPHSDEVAERAEAFGVDTSTLRRWIDQYREGGGVSALIPRPADRRSADRSRLGHVAEAVIAAVIEKDYLAEQRPSTQRAIREVQRRCIRCHIAAPPANSVRSRIARIAERRRPRKRGENEYAKQTEQPTLGPSLDADFPLSEALRTGVVAHDTKDPAAHPTPLDGLVDGDLDPFGDIA